jgi:hypothetical protein
MMIHHSFRLRWGCWLPPLCYCYVYIHPTHDADFNSTELSPPLSPPHAHAQSWIFDSCALAPLHTHPSPQEHACATPFQPSTRPKPPPKPSFHALHARGVRAAAVLFFLVGFRFSAVAVGVALLPAPEVAGHVVQVPRRLPAQLALRLCDVPGLAGWGSMSSMRWLVSGWLVWVDWLVD